MTHIESKLGGLSEVMDRKIAALHNEITFNSAKTKTLVDCVSTSSTNSKVEYDLIQSVNKSVNAAHSKISETDIELTKVSSRVSKNRDDITISKKEHEEELKKLKESIERKRMKEYTVPAFPHLALCPEAQMFQSSL